MPNRLALVPSGMIRKKPIVLSQGVTWPWLLTADQRSAVDNATRGEHLDDEHYGRVLDARVSGHAVKTGRRKG